MLCLFSVDVDATSLLTSLANDVFDCDTADDLDVVSDVFEPKADLKNLVTFEPPPPTLPLPAFSSSKNLNRH